MIRNATELAHAELPGRNCIWGPILAEREIFVLYGDTGTGKTQFALSLATALASGSRFLRWNCNARKVLYLDAEMGEALMKERLQTVTRSFPEFPGSQLGFFCFDGADLDGGRIGFPKLSDRKQHDWYDQVLSQYDVIILDNLGKLTSESLEERGDNEFRAWARAAEYMFRWKARGKTFICIHHANKGGVDFAGSKKKKDDADLFLGLHRLSVSEQTATNHLELRFEKARSLAWPVTEPLHITFDISESIRWRSRPYDAFIQDQINEMRNAKIKDAVITKSLGLSPARLQHYKNYHWDNEDPIEAQQDAQQTFLTEDDNELF